LVARGVADAADVSMAADNKAEMSPPCRSLQREASDVSNERWPELAGALGGVGDVGAFDSFSTLPPGIYGSGSDAGSSVRSTQRLRGRADVAYVSMSSVGLGITDSHRFSANLHIAVLVLGDIVIRSLSRFLFVGMGFWFLVNCCLFFVRGFLVFGIWEILGNSSGFKIEKTQCFLKKQFLVWEILGNFRRAKN